MTLFELHDRLANCIIVYVVSYGVQKVLGVPCKNIERINCLCIILNEVNNTNKKLYKSFLIYLQAIILIIIKDIIKQLTVNISNKYL